MRADFQLYIIAPFLILTFWRARRAACVIVAILCAASVLCTFAIMKIAYPEGSRYSNMIYDKPYTRAAAFLPGMAAAFVVFAEKRRQLPVLMRVVYYVLAPATLLTRTFSTSLPFFSVHWFRLIALSTVVYVPYTQPWSKCTCSPRLFFIP